MNRQRNGMCKDPSTSWSMYLRNHWMLDIGECSKSLVSWSSRGQKFLDTIARTSTVCCPVTPSTNELAQIGCIILTPGFLCLGRSYNGNLFSMFSFVHVKHLLLEGVTKKNPCPEFNQCSKESWLKNQARLRKGMTCQICFPMCKLVHATTYWNWVSGTPVLELKKNVKGNESTEGNKGPCQTHKKS